jgi:hypothetical protein
MLTYIDAMPENLFEDLFNDVYEAVDYLEKNKDNQYLRRSLIKAAFSFIECTPYIFKYKLRRDLTLKRYDYVLNEKEKNLLYEFDDFKIPLLDNLKKTFKLTKKIWKLDNLDLKTDSKEYQALRKSVFVRDRITHPKRYGDIIIKDEEIINIYISIDYIRNTFMNLITRNK